MYFWFNLEDKYYIGKRERKSNLYIDGDLYHIIKNNIFRVKYYSVIIAYVEEGFD